MNFKAGDYVVCVSEVPPHILKNHIYQVDDVSSHLWTLRLTHTPYFFFHERFRLATPEEAAIDLLTKKGYKISKSAFRDVPLNTDFEHKGRKYTRISRDSAATIFNLDDEVKLT